MKRQSYQICEATYDPLRRQFHFNNGEIETLSPLEGKVFAFLLQNVGDCVERSVIFNECWGDVIVSEQALTNVVSKLRKTLAKVTCDCASIRTVSKTGYSLEILSFKPIVPERAETELVEASIDDEMSVANIQPQSKKQAIALQTGSVFGTTKHVLNTQYRRHFNLGFFAIAGLCIAVVAFNLYRAFDSSLPYFVDKSDYAYQYVDNSNHHYLHVVREERYSIEELEFALTTVLPKHCQLNVFVRIYPSVDSPEDDTLSLFILNGHGHSFNYAASVFDPKTSFDSFSKYAATRDYLCGL